MSLKVHGLAPLFEGVIFDADGVLFDSEKLTHEAFLRVVERHGASVSEAELQPLIGISTKGVLDYLVREKKISLSIAQFSEERDEIYEAIVQERGGLECLPGAHELLALLEDRGIPYNLASSGSHRKIRFNLTSSGLVKKFPKYVSADDVKLGKPSPDIFLEAAYRIGLEAEDCLILEDSISGLKGARAAGATGVGVMGSHPVLELQEHAVLVVRHPKELLKRILVSR